jgi:Na+/proline symporter
MVPALAIGLNWKGATREGAIASITVGLVATLLLETLGYMKVFGLPAGVTVSGISLALSLLVFLGVSWATEGGEGSIIDRDVAMVMDT